MGLAGLWQVVGGVGTGETDGGLEVGDGRGRFSPGDSGDGDGGVKGAVEKRTRCL
jgi:hypothetical protein